MSYKSCLNSKRFKLQKFTSIKLVFLGCKYVGSFSLECDWKYQIWTGGTILVRSNNMGGYL